MSRFIDPPSQGGDSAAVNVLVENQALTQDDDGWYVLTYDVPANTLVDGNVSLLLKVLGSYDRSASDTLARFFVDAYPTADGYDPGTSRIISQSLGLETDRVASQFNGFIYIAAPDTIWAPSGGVIDQISGELGAIVFATFELPEIDWTESVTLRAGFCRSTGLVLPGTVVWTPISTQLIQTGAV